MPDPLDLPDNLIVGDGHNYETAYLAIRDHMHHLNEWATSFPPQHPARLHPFILHVLNSLEAETDSRPGFDVDTLFAAPPLPLRIPLHVIRMRPQAVLARYGWVEHENMGRPDLYAGLVDTLRATHAPTPVTAARAWHRAASDGLASTTYADPAYLPADRHWPDDVDVDGNVNNGDGGEGRSSGNSDNSDFMRVMRNGWADPIDRPIPGSPVPPGLDGRLGWSGPWDGGLTRAAGVRRSQTGVRRLGGRGWRPLVRRGVGREEAAGRGEGEGGEEDGANGGGADA
ncbi:hypothetical protein DBV05_g8401 [Lasiodiplodia theobromae]|uniref:Uncharacterized protein n=1 Tax=Lasiodiplodia theobromae TaxID=45133 RepID=A0A5N5D5A1_9PEZI|nr:hypothetical protein DBV05_g8401 [Lasiodiplodia theobromae]